MNESSPLPEYRRFVPSPALGRYAEAIWVQHSVPTPDALPTTVLPSGRIDLVLHYGDRFARIADGTREPLPRAQAVGQQQRPLVVQALGTTGIVIVRLKPWGASALFGADLGATSNRIIDLEQVWGRYSIHELLERLATATSMAQRARLADGFVARRLLHEDVDRLAVAAVGAINAGWGRQPIAVLAQRFGLGRRQFNRRFTSAVGAAPKQLSRVLRTQKAVACLRAGVATQAVIERCGYSDQSHFIRDVVAHYGRRPQELVRLAPSAPHRYFNCGDVNAFCGMTYL